MRIASDDENIKPMVDEAGLPINTTQSDNRRHLEGGGAHSAPTNGSQKITGEMT